APARGIKVIKWCILDVLERCPPQRPCEGCLLWNDCHGIAKDKCDGFFSIDDAIRIKQRSSEDSWKTEMLCEKPNVSGCVFPTFDRAVHVKEGSGVGVGGSGNEAEMWLAMDCGFANPFVCMWIVNGEGGTVHVLDEYVQPGRTVAEHIEQIEARTHWGKPRLIACDPAGGGANEQAGE